MKKIIQDNYDSIVKRGLITTSTTRNEFLDKLFEEVAELEQAEINNDWGNMCEELADVILVCLNWAKHYNIDIEAELIAKIKKNQARPPQVP